MFDLGRRNKLAYRRRCDLMLKAILVSPQFLFITPAGEAESERRRSFPWMTINSHPVCRICYGPPCPMMN